MDEVPVNWEAYVMLVNENVNIVALGRLDDLKLQKPFYRFYELCPSTGFCVITP